MHKPMSKVFTFCNSRGYGSVNYALSKEVTKSYSKRKKDYISAACLLKQINAVPRIRLFPSQLKLIFKYQQFLTLNFPESEDSLLSSHDKNCTELSKILAEIYLKNDSFAAYTDACLQTAEKFQMLKTLNTRRKEARVERNLEKGNLIISDEVYELLFRYFASKDDWNSIERTLSWIQEDGITPTFKMCIAPLACLGGLLQRSLKGKQFSKAFQLKVSTEERLFHAFIEGKIYDVIALAEKHGINVYDGLLRYPRGKGSLEKILTALLFVNLDRRPNLNFLSPPPFDSSRYSKTIEISNRVSSALDKAPLSPENLLSEVFQSSDAMMEAFKEQLRLESQGQVQIPPALPFFEEMLKTLPHHNQSQQKIHQSHRKQIYDCFLLPLLLLLLGGLASAAVELDWRGVAIPALLARRSVGRFYQVPIIRTRKEITSISWMKDGN
ncbi:unnamed protein product [Rodentolepis nana]|uniref:LETM1 domain-containing protein n=1 Tax=Rodentolepis nana TaxID=102285 RepID=A0A0R3TZ86_RODNA|nr:unnamed protein product [Rodentolepis nana]